MAEAATVSAARSVRCAGACGRAARLHSAAPRRRSSPRTVSSPFLFEFMILYLIVTSFKMKIIHN